MQTETDTTKERPHLLPRPLIANIQHLKVFGGKNGFALLPGDVGPLLKSAHEDDESRAVVSQKTSDNVPHDLDRELLSPR